MRPKLRAIATTLVDHEGVIVASFGADYGHGAKLAAEVAARYNAAMTEARAREVLASGELLWVDDSLRPDVFRHPDEEDWCVALEGGRHVTADQLEAIAWWMRNKRPA